MGRKQKGLSFYRKNKKISASLIKEILSCLLGMAIMVFLAFGVVYVAGMSTGMVGVSMEPVLYNGQSVLINRCAYMLTSPKAGDIVVFLPNGNTNSHYYIKRVVAVPGDTVQIIGGRLYVNGTMEEIGEYDKMAEAGIANNPITLGLDEYFVLGDNRNNSEDSRSANVGLVKKQDMKGKVWFALECNERGMGFIP